MIVTVKKPELARRPAAGRYKHGLSCSSIMCRISRGKCITSRLLLSVLICSALEGCASPFRQSSAVPGTASMENSILVHDLSDGDLLTHPSMLPVDQGVHEIWPKTLPVNGQSILANGRRKGVVPAGGRTIAQTKRTDQNGLPMSLIHAIADWDFHLQPG